MVDRIYSAELKLNDVHSSDTKAPFLVVNLSISNGTVSTKFMMKEVVSILIYSVVDFPFLDCDVPRHTFMGCTFLDLFVSLQHFLTFT